MRHLIVLSALAAGLATMGMARPASAVVGYWSPCTASSPLANQVYIYENTNFGGPCAALTIGFYFLPGNTFGGFGLPENRISSMKLGATLRARVFNGLSFTSNWTMIAAGQSLATMPSGWDNTISSIRIEQASRSVTCNDLVPGEFALFREVNFTGDCVVLKYRDVYSQEAFMGIAENGVTSINAGPAYPGCDYPYSGNWQVCLHNNYFFEGWVRCFGSGTSDPNLSDNGVNDQTSSVSTYPLCIY